LKHDLYDKLNSIGAEAQMAGVSFTPWAPWSGKYPPVPILDVSPEFVPGFIVAWTGVNRLNTVLI
jgi:hypothetical protein